MTSHQALTYHANRRVQGWLAEFAPAWLLAVGVPTRVHLIHLRPRARTRPGRRDVDPVAHVAPRAPRVLVRRAVARPEQPAVVHRPHDVELRLRERAVHAACRLVVVEHAAACVGDRVAAWVAE